jgi:nucleotide-binding universal stress UspA family protein
MYEVIVWATDGSDAADVALPVARDLAVGPEDIVPVECV